MDKLSIVIVSSQLLFRHTLASTVSLSNQYEEVREFDSWLDISSLMPDISQCVLLVDAQLPESHINKIMSYSKKNDNKVIIIGSSYDKERLVSLMPLRADGYVTTEMSWDEFLEILEKIERGGPIIADSLFPAMMEKMCDSIDKLDRDRLDTVAVELDEDKYNMLTPREKEILELLTEGYTNGQIAEKLVISIYTVKNHVHNILEKLEINNRAQLVSYALTRGLVS